MHDTVSIPLSDLLLDTSNARLGDEQPSQQAVYLTLGKQQGRRLVALAEDIVAHGVDPTTLPAVIATDDTRRRYRVIEGNRRVLTLKALDNPTIVSGALNSTDQRRLGELAAQYADNPVEELQCILFDTEEDARHWVVLRHTGANDGAGLVEWDTNEQDRFLSRHGAGQARRPAGQILDYLERIDGRDSSGAKVVTTVQRIINTKDVRDRLGIELQDGQVVSHYPAEEVLKGLRRVVNDLRSGTIKVKDVYEASDRRNYINGFPPADLPDPTKRLTAPQPLADLGQPGAPSTTKRGVRARPKLRVKPPRTAVAASSGVINPGPPRLNAIYNELASLNADLYPNAGVVLLRVFLELSVDNEIDRYSLMTEAERAKSSLSKRLKAVAERMYDEGRLNDQLRKAITKVADSQHTIAASTVTFNQYVHNQYVHPKPAEVRTAWDELQPFLEKVWA